MKMASVTKMVNLRANECRAQVRCILSRRLNMRRQSMDAREHSAVLKFGYWSSKTAVLDVNRTQIPISNAFMRRSAWYWI